MIDFLLDEQRFVILLLAGAVASPAAALLWARWRGGPRRLLIAAAAFGPLALALWFLHSALIGWLGFASVAGSLILLGVGTVTGIAAGIWIAADPALSNTDRSG